MVTKFRSEYGNLDLQRNRGKYENRPDLKKGEREKGWENGEEMEGEPARKSHLWITSSPVGTFLIGQETSRWNCNSFRPKMRRVHPVSGEGWTGWTGGKNREISLNTLRAWNLVKKLDGGGEIRDTNLQLFTDASFVFFQSRVGRMLVFPLSFFSF